MSVQEVISSLKGLCNLLYIIAIIISAWRNRFQVHLPQERENIILQVRGVIILQSCRALLSLWPLALAHTMDLHMNIIANHWSK